MRNFRALRIGLRSAAWLLAIAGAWLQGVAWSDSLDSSAQRRLHEAVFEVVIGKPQADPLTYEKPLPLDLLPFEERTSTYRSIGTAFVIDPNRFVTAAHVMGAGILSQNGPLGVRDAKGTVYLVDKITKYSVAEDYAEFTVKDGPHVKPLETQPHPELNESVYAVGNALGEGIIIRDGLYTSDTPEDRSGRWKWLRFSAAASPGNSGGPLVDHKGRVIGVILRKSPSENLNVAVNIAQVQHGSSESAVLESRFTYVFAPMLAQEPASIDEHLPLPKSMADFSAAIAAVNDAAIARVQSKYLADHAAQVFPHGAESTLLLNQLWVSAFPRAVYQKSDNSWAVTDPKPQKAQLEHNGLVETAPFKSVLFARFRLPDDLALADAYGDSKGFMDLLLKNVQLRRQVGSETVRVTSLGRAEEDTAYKDAYGRNWQVRMWRMPYSDTVMLSLDLPTPVGYVAIVEECPTFMQAFVTRSLETLTGFTYVSLAGPLKRWREYLAQPLVPEVVHGLDIHFDYGKEFHYRSARLGIEVANAVQSVDPTSHLILKMTYFNDGDKTVWDVGGVYLAATEQKGNWIDVLRRHRPPASLPDTATDRWRNIETGAHPFTGTAYSTDGGTRIETVLNAKKIAAHESDIAYTVTLAGEGTQDAQAMKRRLDAIVAGVTVLEK